jgi:hypothetical protein
MTTTLVDVLPALGYAAPASTTRWTPLAPQSAFPAPPSSSNPAGESAPGPVSRSTEVSAIETQPLGWTFVAVGGGVSDDPRVALNPTKRTVALANRHSIGRRQRVTSDRG